MVRVGSVYSNLPCMPASPFVTVVRGGSVRSKTGFPIHHSGSRRLGGIEPPLTHCIRTSPNSLEPSLYCCIPLRHSGSMCFWEVEPPQTNSNLPCRRSSPYITVVPEGSVQLNLPELTLNYPSDQLSPSSQWFEEVRCGRTTPNPLETAL